MAIEIAAAVDMRRSWRGGGARDGERLGCDHNFCCVCKVCSRQLRARVCRRRCRLAKIAIKRAANPATRDCRLRKNVACARARAIANGGAKRRLRASRNERECRRLSTKSVETRRARVLSADPPERKQRRAARIMRMRVAAASGGARALARARKSLRHRRPLLVRPQATQLVGPSFVRGNSKRPRAMALHVFACRRRRRPPQRRRRRRRRRR